jgi:hypothetical protein
MSWRPKTENISSADKETSTIVASSIVSSVTLISLSSSSWAETAAC